MTQATKSAEENHWGLVLAAGSGTRLQDYIQQRFGHPLPKQYVNFTGGRSMIEHTFKRAETLISRRNIVTVIAKQHLAYPRVCQQLASRYPGTLIVQPANKETGPGILLPMMHILKRCPEAIVTVFPSDHFILQEKSFMAHVKLAARAVAQNPSRIVLLAMEAHSPEEEYGYVVPAESSGEIELHGTRRVTRFVEKPDQQAAHELVRAGALWNTMVMVFKAKTLFHMISRIDPEMYRQFRRIFESLGSRHEQKTIEAVYAALQPTNFSKDILEKIARVYPGAVSVLPVFQVYWSDWGSARRLRAGQRLLRVFKPAGPRLEVKSGTVRKQIEDLPRVARQDENFSRRLGTERNRTRA